MSDVQRPPLSGQNPAPSPAQLTTHGRAIIRPVDRSDGPAVAIWGHIARGLVSEVRDLACDATRGRNERVRSRRHLRRMICRTLRELDARLNAIDPPPSGEPEAPPAP